MKPTSSTDEEDTSSSQYSSDSDSDDDNDDENEVDVDLTQDAGYSQDAQRSPDVEETQSQSLIDKSPVPLSKALPPLPSLDVIFSKPSTSAATDHIDTSTPKAKKGRKTEKKFKKDKKSKKSSPELTLFAEVSY